MTTKEVCQSTTYCQTWPWCPLAVSDGTCDPVCCCCYCHVNCVVESNRIEGSLLASCLRLHLLHADLVKNQQHIVLHCILPWSTKKRKQKRKTKKFTDFMRFNSKDRPRDLTPAACLWTFGRALQLVDSFHYIADCWAEPLKQIFSLRCWTTGFSLVPRAANVSIVINAFAVENGQIIQIVVLIGQVYYFFSHFARSNTEPGAFACGDQSLHDDRVELLEKDFVMRFWWRAVV